MNRTAKSKKMVPTLYLTIAALIIACLAGVYAWFLISDYEKGVSEIYAQEQDGYVQLVLDQINLQTAGTDEQIIQNILGTLDSSTNRYWTLSHDETLVFVKDVLETSRYKSFSSDTYYNTLSSRDFVNSLQQNKVTHEVIEISGRKFIASGVKFVYNNKDYQICLLTNAEIMLENNTYLNTKINLIIMIIVILLIFVISTIVLARLVNSQNRALLAEKKTEEDLRRNLEQMDEQLHDKKMYDSETMVFGSSMIPTMLQKLEERGARPLVLATVPFDEKSYQTLTDEGQLLLGKNVVRMKLDEEHMLLIFVQCRKKEADRKLSALASYGIKAEQIREISESEAKSVKECYQEIISGGSGNKE